ncbi:hypothetical protein OIE75_40635 [Streptomyces sp. NBC_01723]|uniref:hypothetical protein n=1 Tax=Streptomyces sp. NBC_01723 TaxID=2975921 RepID=UPI002E342804|nr:hypothetical protein [Streptomyces sp. NBC_01723]
MQKQALGVTATASATARTTSPPPPQQTPRPQLTERGRRSWRQTVTVHTSHVRRSSAPLR